MTCILMFKILTCLLNPNIVLKPEYRPSAVAGWALGAQRLFGAPPSACPSLLPAPLAPGPAPGAVLGAAGPFPSGWGKKKGGGRDYLKCLGELTYSSAAAAEPCAYPSPQQPGLVSSLPTGSAVREAEVGVSAAGRHGGPGGRRRWGDVGQRRLCAGPEGEGEARAAAGSAGPKRRGLRRRGGRARSGV